MHQLYENTAVVNYTTKFFEPIQNTVAGSVPNIYSMQFWKQLAGSQFRGFDNLSANYGTFLPTYVKWRFTFKPFLDGRQWGTNGATPQLADIYWFVWAGVNQYTIAGQDTTSQNITKAIFELPGFKKKPLVSTRTLQPVGYVTNVPALQDMGVINRLPATSIAGSFNLRKMAGAAWGNQYQYQNEMNHDGNSFGFVGADMDYHKFLHVGLVVDDQAYLNGLTYIPQGTLGVYAVSCKIYGLVSNRRMRITM